MHQKIESRRDFLTKATIVAALGASTAKLFGEQTLSDITDDAIKHAEQLAGISFTESERAQMLQTIEEQQAILASRITQGEIPNALSPATVFNPRIPGKPLQLCTSSGNVYKTLSGAGAGPCPRANEELAFAPVWKLSQWMKKREITSEQLTKLSIERLKLFNPTLNCVISMTEKTALAQAKQADNELDAGNWRGPLHGIPWGAKDIIDTAGDKTTWGAAAYKERVSETNAVVVDKLEEAGAVLVAKLAVGALAYGDIWFGGTCKNPFDISEGSSGSSAGPAAATAAGLVPFTLGTETYGSIVSPCMRCGTTGLRPTFGRVARTGVMALCWSLDKIGPICRSVLDTAIVLNAINGEDAGDPSSVTEPFYFDASQGVKGLRVGYDPALFGGPTEQFDREALHAAEQAGATLVKTTVPKMDNTVLLIPLFVEAAAAFEELTRSNQDDLLVWQDDDAWPNSFRQTWFIPAIEHLQASRLRRQIMEQMQTWMNDEFDAFLTPSFSDLLLTTNGTGHPALVLRTGMIDGKPVGTTLIGRLFDEGTICRLGMAIETKLGVSVIRPSITG
jgi:Asp-tRNA(Asn)/Glu-tRNA(Gln) amidotransferase A subunit family amidase